MLPGTLHSGRMIKSELRAALRRQRDSFVAGLDPAVAAIVFRAPPGPLRAWIDQAQVIAGYVPIGSEADPAAILDHAAAQGRVTALPFVESRTVPIRFLRWTPGDSLVDGPFGLRQPERAAPEVEPDLILTPLVGFDRRLHRIGQGAAHYDRAFARWPDARRVGVAWSAQEVDFVPDDPWDVPLDAVLTEREWIVRDREDA